jgi:transcriptional regulator with XRE-family HTH domain
VPASGHAHPVSVFDLTGALRRIRRRADMSQRELAAACGVATSVFAQAESRRRGLSVDLLVRAAALAQLRLALLDDQGNEVTGMTDEGARDRGYRRLPAHLDTFHSDARRSHYEARRTRTQPTYTFYRIRADRDACRRQHGTPDDHHVPQPGDSPAERAAARREAALRRAEERRRRAFEANPGRPFDPGFTCECPPECAALDDRNGRPVHADGCPCGCDVA